MKNCEKYQKKLQKLMVYKIWNSVLYKLGFLVLYIKMNFYEHLSFSKAQKVVNMVNVIRFKSLHDNE